MFVVVALLILANALYVAAEFAVAGVRASRIQQKAENGGSSLAVRLLPILLDTSALDRYIAACQIDTTVSSLVLGAFGQATIGLALGGTLIERFGMASTAAYGLSATLVLVVLIDAGGAGRADSEDRGAAVPGADRGPYLLARGRSASARVHAVWLDDHDAKPDHGDEAIDDRISIAAGPIFQASRGFGNCLRMNCGHSQSARLGRLPAGTTQ